MDSTIISAIISACAAIAVCLYNNHKILQKTEKAHQDNIVLIAYRLEELEKKVDKHNNVIERTYELERRSDVLEEKMSVANHRIADIEKREDDHK